MKKREKFILEEEQVLKDTLALCLAKLIRLHYKYYKNKEFNTFKQYCNSYTYFDILSEDEILKLYHVVNGIMEQEYNLFFAHYELDKPIYLMKNSERNDIKC